MPTISNLPAPIAASATDLLPIVQSDGQTHNITPSAMAVLATGATTALAIAKRFSYSKFTTEFGVVGDGVTDDTAALLEAITQCAGVCELVHPANLNSLISAQITPSAGVTGLHFKIQGTITFNATAPLANSIFGGNLSDVLIEGGGTINCNAPSGQSSTTSVRGVFNSNVVSNLVVRDITMKNSKNWLFNVTNCSDCYAIRCTFINSGNSIEYASSGTNCWFIDCIVDTVNDLGMGFYAGIVGGGIIGCTARNANGPGLFILNDSGQTAPCKNITISNNISYKNALGIQTQDSGGTSPHTGIIISGNQCYENLTGGIWIGGVYFGSVCDNVLTANTYTGTQPGDLYVAGNNEFIKVSANLVFDTCLGSTLGTGINAQVANHLMITDNFTWDNQATPTMQAGLGGTSGAANMVCGNFWGPSIGEPNQFVYASDDVSFGDFTPTSGISTFGFREGSLIPTNNALQGISTASITPTGTTFATAAQAKAQYTVIDGATSGGVILPSQIGVVYTLYNNGVTGTLNIYSPTGTLLTTLANGSICRFYGYNSGTWFPA